MKFSLNQSVISAGLGWVAHDEASQTPTRLKKAARSGAGRAWWHDAANAAAFLFQVWMK
jgi:hypothetical protein